MAGQGLRLYTSPTSPFARMVRVVAIEAGLEQDIVQTTATGTPLDPGSMPVGRNPLGKIPVLERPDGPALYDSRVICRYLDDISGGRLYPAKPRLWETLTLEATGHGITEAAVLMVYEARVRPEDRRFPEWVEGQWAKVARALDAIEARWMAHLAGPLDMGQIAVGCALGYLDFRHEARGWRAGRPALAAWFKAFDGRPAMAATRPA
jgi:glutathione S-transferase